MSFDHKHPILLPKSDPFITLLVDHFHYLPCHCGPHLLQSILQQTYWFLSARSVVRQRIWKCNHCFRFKPKPSEDLPSERVNQANKAFLSTGVDYTGTFNIIISRRREVKTQKP